MNATPPDPAPADTRERLTSELDSVIAKIAQLLGPQAMAALVAGRVARAAQLNLTRPA